MHGHTAHDIIHGNTIMLFCAKNLKSQSKSLSFTMFLLMLKIWYNVGQSWIGCRVCLQSALYSTCTFVMETVEEEERVDEGME